MKKHFLVAALVAGGALVLPTAVQASRDDLQLTIGPTFNFASIDETLAIGASDN